MNYMLFFPGDKVKVPKFTNMNYMLFFPGDKVKVPKFTCRLPVKRHARVKTWTRHVDLFKKDFVIVPINEQ